jgi:hypothetical protein
MVIERMIFWLKYGNEQAAAELWQQMVDSFPESGTSTMIPSRNSIGLTGRMSTVEHESKMRSINDHNPMMYYWVINTRMQAFYRRFVDLCDSATREMYKIEHETGQERASENPFVERHTFHLHFGQAKAAIVLWKQIIEEAAKAGIPSLRILTDIVGPSYTLLVEANYKKSADLRQGGAFWTESENMNALHREFISLCRSAELNYLRIQYDLSN